MFRVTSVMNGISGAPYYSTFHFDGFADEMAQDAAQYTKDFWEVIKSTLNAGLTVQVQPEVERVNVATGLVEEVFNTVVNPVVGTNTASLLPRSAQGLVRWKTGTIATGRRIQGRTFIPGMTVSALANGTVVPATRTTLTNAGTALIVAGGATNRLSIYSPTKRVLAPVTAATVWTEFASLTSRRD